MKIFVGTSGWFYEWNEDQTLDWYIANSGLNSIELNASFYRFPFPNQVKAWAKKGTSLRWAIKVNRLITHIFKFSTRGAVTWQRFAELFKPLDKFIDFYLFQLPPNYTPKAIKQLTKFVNKIKLGERFALEPRNDQWFNSALVNWAKEMNITWVSIDAPEFPNTIYKTTDKVYLRMHGRTGWYSHNYSDAELKEIAHRIYVVKPKEVYIYFNNNHNMLKNAQRMDEILRKI
uniref:DUF72 domain-containing protein n=1 Tax=candidate division WOR-3 bacterium TaxID=2052148 RepID=A0A7C6EDT4_UNCW3